MSNPVFHLGITKAAVKGATIAIIPGDPKRVEGIVKHLANPVQLSYHREFNLYLAYVEDTPIVVCSTGIGGPSTSIVVEELAQCGIDTFLRLGTTGAIQDNIDVGDMIVTTAAVRLDGASLHFCPVEFPAVSHFDICAAMRAAAIKCGKKTHMGITASSDTFYPGQERTDTFTGRVRRSLRGSMQEWKEMGVLNFEMESATLFAMCASSGLRAGCVAGVLVNRNKQQIPDSEASASIEADSIAVIIETVKIIINNDN